jgi:hypothetical protein
MDHLDLTPSLISCEGYPFWPGSLRPRGAARGAVLDVHWRDQARRFTRGAPVMAQQVAGLRWPTGEKIFTDSVATERRRCLTWRAGLWRTRAEQR